MSTPTDAIPDKPRSAYLDLSDKLARHLYENGHRIGEAAEIAGKIAYLLTGRYGGYMSETDDEFRANARDRARKYAQLLTEIADGDWE